MKNRIPYLLLALCLLAFLLRFFFISHGISHHPDERGIIMMTERISWERPFPDSFAYGSLPFYLLKSVSELSSFLWPRAASYDGLFYVGRGINALIAVWLVWATFRFARTLFNDTTPAYWAAFLVGTNTFVIQNSHFFTVDLLLTTLITEALIQMTRIPREGRWRQYLLASIFTGLALATKIGALSLLAPAALAFVFHRLAWRENPIPLLCVMVGAILTVTGISLPIGLTLIILAAPLAWFLPIVLIPNTEHLSLIFCRGWRYLIVCLPLMLFLFYAGEPYAFDWKGWLSFFRCLGADGCHISTQIFSERFLSNVGAEIAMVRGVEDPRPYTVQYVGTTPYLYHLNELFWTTLGPITAILTLIGLFLELLTPPTKTRAIPLTWGILFFLTVAGSFVKFPRYLLPLYPLLFCYTGRAITVVLDRLGGLREHLTTTYVSPSHGIRPRRGSVILTALASLVIGAPILVRSFAFTSIYTVPHPYELASQWAFEHIPDGATILGVHWDDKLPLDIPSRTSQVFSMWSPHHELAIYEPDSEQKIRVMASQLQSADYIIFPSAKIPASIPRWPERYPFSSRLLRGLFEGDLGFTLEKTVKNYPSLGAWYRIDDDISDESLTLYDHPKVYVFKKTKLLGADEIINRVNDSLHYPPQETIRLIQTISAHDGDNSEPFVPYSLGSIISWLFVIELLAWIIRSPLKEYIGLSDNAAAFASRPIGIFLFFGLFWWLNAVHIANAHPSSLWILACACLGLRCILRQKTPIARRTILTSATFFVVPFLTILCVRSFQSEIFWGEKPMDFSFLNYFYRATSLPPTDPWAAGNTMRYYYLGSYLMAQLGKMAGVSPAIAYNLAIATIGAAMVCSLAALLSAASTVSARTAGWIGVAITFLSNPESVLVCWEQGRVNFDTFWASTRLFRSPAFTEYPIWALIHADLHAHFIAAPLGVLVALGLSLLTIRPSRSYQYLGARAFLGMAAGLLLATNTWDMISLAVVGGCSGLLVSLNRLSREGLSAAHRIFVEGVLDIFLVGLMTSLVALPFLRDGLSGATSLGRGYVYGEEFNNLSHLLRHFGIWLLVLLVAGLFTLFNQKKDLIRQLIALPIFLMPPLALFGDSALRKGISGVPYSYLAVSLLLSLIAHQIAFHFEEDPRAREKGPFVAALLWACSLIILFGELRFIGDRMNTIFKFYTSAWWILGVSTSWLMVEWFKNKTSTPRPTLLREIVVTTLLFGIFVALFFADTKTGFLFFSFSLIVVSLCLAIFCIYLLFSPLRNPPRQLKGFNNFRLPEYLALSLIGISLCFSGTGSLLNVFSLTTINRAPQPIPSIDGTAYLSRHFSRDWDLCRWLNRQVRGTPTIIEASGDGYQDYTRITMNTGLPTVLGWEHHTSQRGTSGDDITARREAIQQFYSTTSAESAALILRRYRVKYVIVGEVERRLYRSGAYSPDGLGKFDFSPELFQPVFKSGSSAIYRVLG